MAEHVCPFWVAYFLASPFRRLWQNPGKILGPYVEPGMTVLDFGPAMGFFSLPMARMVGPDGTIVCVDLQPKMLDGLARRAARAGVAERIETHACGSESLRLEGRDGSFDFALAFAVMHEVPDPARCLHELHHLLKPGAALLLAEPRHHVKADDFERTIAFAREMGFTTAEPPRIRSSLAVLLQKPN